MMLDDIGFYTLSDERARTANTDSPLMRCELILTDKCNFKCPYCRGLRSDIAGTMDMEKAKNIIDLWASERLQNIRFSGGEPTTYPALEELVGYAKNKGVNRIAISTNGSASKEKYDRLIWAGANDFSISLDACCSSFGNEMAGVSGVWERVVSNIRYLSGLTYVTVGVVVTEETISELPKVIGFADELDVSDIRIISSAQFNSLLGVASFAPQAITDKNPILKYRINNIKVGRNVRGLTEFDSHRCPLVLDDMAIAGDYHFPCIIYMREGGNPIGRVGPNMRKERKKWFDTHDSHNDIICKSNCLDVCIDYNNAYCKFHRKEASIPRLNASLFEWTTWKSGSIHDLGIPCRFAEMIKPCNREILQQYATGWCEGELLPCRPKQKHVAVMFHKNGEDFWFHMRDNEFYEVFVKEEL